MKFIKALICTTILSGPCLASNKTETLAAKMELKRLYEHWCSHSSDIVEHVPVLHRLAKECSSVTEIGLRDMTSSWGIFQGLAENSAAKKSYVGIDIANPPAQTLDLAQRLVRAQGISFRFWQANDMEIMIDPTDLLFIDSLHTYCHLTYELEKFSPKVRKYIAMHDTSEPWGELDDNQYHGDFSEYPAHIDKTKRGLWAAVEDFLKMHPEWVLQERRLNNHGFTILKRVAE